MKIFVFVHIQVVEGITVARVSIGKSEIDSNGELDLTTSENVLQESVPLVEGKVLETNGLVTATSCQLELELALAQLGKIAREIAQVYMFTALLRLEELNANLAFWVLVSEL